MQITAKVKKYIAVASMAVVAAGTIPFLRDMLPTWATGPLFGTTNLIQIGAYALLVSAYWVAVRETD